MAKDMEVKRDDTNRSMDRYDTDFEDVIEQFFDYPFGRTFGEVAPVARQAMPTVQETEDGYLLAVDVPGIPQEDIEITVNGNLLSIRAERSENEETKGSGYRRQYRKFQQTLALPTTVDAERIEASCEHGALEIRIPKTTESKAKKITVQSGKLSAPKKKDVEVAKH